MPGMYLYIPDCIKKQADLRKYVGDGDEVSYQAWENIFLLLLHVPLHILDHQVLRGGHNE